MQFIFDELIKSSTAVTAVHYNFNEIIRLDWRYSSNFTRLLGNSTSSSTSLRFYFQSPYLLAHSLLTIRRFHFAYVEPLPPTVNKDSSVNQILKSWYIFSRSIPVELWTNGGEDFLGLFKEEICGSKFSRVVYQFFTRARR